MSNRSERRPDELALDMSGRVLQIKWLDGHVSRYGFDYLRHKCPCAECRPWTHGEGAAGEPPASLANANVGIASAQDVQFVGSYALTVRFGDGHSAGIYTWPYLRQICPCGEHGG